MKKFLRCFFALTTLFGGAYAAFRIYRDYFASSDDTDETEEFEDESDKKAKSGREYVTIQIKKLAE